MNIKNNYMNYYVIKLKHSDVFVDGYKNYKISFTNTLSNAMLFNSLTFLNEFIQTYMSNCETEIYKIILQKILKNLKNVCKTQK